MRLAAALLLLLGLFAIPRDSRAQLAGTALQFDGIDDYVDVPPSNDLQLVQTNFTIEAWVFSNNYGGNYRIISGITSPIGFQILISSMMPGKRQQPPTRRPI